MANTSGGAKLTLQGAWDEIAKLDAAIYGITIHVGTATFSGALLIDKAPLGGTGVTIDGNGATNTILSVSGTNVRAIMLTTPVSLTLSNLKITTSSGTNSDCVHVACAGARVTLGAGMNFGASAGAHMRILNNGHVFATAAYAISGAIGAGGHVWTQFGGLFEAYALTVTITGTPALGPFAAAESGGAQIWYGMTFSGSATGARYSATLNGVLNTFGGGASYFPGNAGGSTATGGQYA